MILSIWFVLLSISWKFFLLPLQLPFYIYCLVLWFLVVFQIFCIFFLYILSIFQFNSLSICYAILCLDLLFKFSLNFPDFTSVFNIFSYFLCYMIYCFTSTFFIFYVIYSFNIFIFSTLFKHNRISREDTNIISIF